MNNPNRSRPQTPTAINPEASDSRRTATSTMSPELISEAVIASYIHDISVRHSHGAATKRVGSDAADRH